MKCIGRWSKLFFLICVITLNLGHSAAGQTTCPSDGISYPIGTPPDLNRDVNIYGTIYEDTINANCRLAALNALKTVIDANLARGVTVIGPNTDPLDAYQHWLESGNVAQIFAASVRLFMAGVMDSALDQRLQIVRDKLKGSYDGNGGLLSKEPGCGINPNFRYTGDACFDDYTVGSTGFAWVAAYEHLRQRDAAAFIDAAEKILKTAFSTDASICIIDPAIDTKSDPSIPAETPVGPSGPCIPHQAGDDVITKLENGQYEVLSLNHGGESLGYGIGLMTSVSTTMVGLSLAGANLGFLDHEEKVIARAIFEEAQKRTAPDGSVFLNLCWRLDDTRDVDANGNKIFQILDTRPCDDQVLSPTPNQYKPKMFPVRPFYDAFIFPEVPNRTNGYDFGFPSDSPDTVFQPQPFFDIGRKVFYWKLGWGAFSLPKRRAVAHSVNSSVVSSPYDFHLVDPADSTLEFPTSFNLSGDLPAGISFSSTTGEFSGTPAPGPGIFNFLVTAVYSDGGTLTQDYALPVCQFSSGAPNLIVNASTNFSFSTGPLSNNPLHLLVYDLVSGSLPSGALLDENTGTVSGVATTPGTYSARVRVARRPSGTVEVAACPGGTTTDALYQILVGCGAGCQQNEGYNDGLDSDNVWGWAWNSSFPTSPLQVDIYESAFDTVPDGTPILGRVTANLFRQDLQDAGKGDGNHAFVFAIPDSLKDGNTHRIHVTFAGTKTELNWSPRVLTAPARFTGVHSANDCSRIDGYAVDSWQSNNPVDVNIFDNGQLLATLVASYDATVVPATSGHGAHGFLYYTPDRLKDGAIHQITVTFKLFGTQLATTNRSLSCPAVPAASNPAWEGWFDNVTCDRVDGWAWDANRPNSPIDVAIYYEGGYLATLTANYFGQDLLDAGKGNGVHRYAYYLPDLLKDGSSHHLVAQIVGQNTNLPISSPSTNGNVSCAALPPPVPPPPHAITNTSAGPSVTASSGPARGSAPGVDVTFSSVSVAGLTSFVPYDPAALPALPSGYAYPHAAISPVAFDLSTTAGYSGQIMVTFTILGENDPGEFSQLRILHLEGGVWQDRTSWLSTFNAHQVSATVASFSPFVVARLVQRPVTTSVGIVGGDTTVYGQNVRFTAHVYGLGSSAIPTGNVTFFDGNQVFATQPLDASGQASLNTPLLTAGTHFISVSYSGDFSFPASSGSTTQVVVPAPLSITVASASRTYGVTNPSFTGAVAGLLNGDNITAAYSTTATPASNVGSYAITATLSDPSGKLGNYTATVQNGVLTITVTPLTVTPNPASRFYGDANPALTGTLSGLQNNDNITAAYQSSATAASVVGTYSITSTLSDPGGKLSNYSVSQPVGTLTIQPAPLQVTANNKTRMYGDPNPVLDGTVTGLRNADNIQAQYATTATMQSLVGNYPITSSLADPNGVLGNYSVTLQNGTLTVTRSNVALALPVFNPAGGTYPPGSTVTITEPTSSLAAIHYTIDGSTPTAASPLYTGPVVVNNTTNFHAMATQAEYLDSGVSSAFISTTLSLSTSPASQTTVNCGSVSYSVSIFPPSNSVGTLTFSVTGLPAGVTASFSPATVNNSGSSTLTVTTSTSTPPGTYTLTISAGNGSISGSKPVTLVVQDFNFSLAPASQTVTAGGGASYSLTGTIANGFAATVSLGVTGLPAGASGAFSPVSYTGAGVSTMSVSTSTSTPVGTYTLTVSGTNACRVHTFPVTLVVNAPPPTGPVINSLSVSAGPVGTAVTISGLNFGATQGTNTVSFNGTAAQATAWSSGSISVTVPRGATTGNIVVSAGGQVSNGIAFTVQDDAEHIFATNCSTCGWQTTDFTIQSSALYGYTIQSGDILYFYQWQSVGSVAGINICFPGGDVAVCTDDGSTVDQNGKPIHADTIQGTTHFRRVDLSPNAGQTISQIIFHSHGTTRAGRWDVYFSNVQIVSADGTVRSIFVTGSNPSLFGTSSYGVTGRGSVVEHAHVW